MRKLLHKSTNNFHDSWVQGFHFDKKLEYGIYQDQGGPCGVLATVQAFYLKHLLYVSKTPLTEKVSKAKKQNLIAAAITDILINSSNNF